MTLRDRGFDLIFAHWIRIYRFRNQRRALLSEYLFRGKFRQRIIENVASIDIQIDDAAYVEGVIAGGVSKVAWQGPSVGSNYRQSRSTFDGFKRGFLSVRPNGRLLSVTRASSTMSEPPRRPLSRKLVREPMYSFTMPTPRVWAFFRQLHKLHVYAFGTIRNQNDIAPDVILASAVTSTAKHFLKSRLR